MKELVNVADDLKVTLYTESDLQQARSRGRFVGWIQGGLAVIVGGWVLQLLGWIPAVLILGVIGYVLYKLLSGGTDESTETV